MDLKLLRFGVDYLVLVKDLTGSVVLPGVIKTFSKRGFGLEHTLELPSDGEVQFSDFVIKLMPYHTCWIYKPTSTNPFLSYESAHSKIVKNGVATSCTKSAMTKSCKHLIAQILAAQIKRVRAAACSQKCVLLACEKNR